MKFAFRPENPLNLWHAAIATASGGSIVHTEVQLPDGRWFTSQEPVGCIIHEIDEAELADPTQWIVVDVPEIEHAPDGVEWAEAQVAHPVIYDWIAACLSPFGKLIIHVWMRFCSQVCKEYAQRHITGLNRLPGSICVYPFKFLHECTQKPMPVKGLRDAADSASLAADKLGALADDIKTKIDLLAPDVYLIIHRTAVTVDEAKTILAGVLAAESALKGIL